MSMFDNWMGQKKSTDNGNGGDGNNRNNSGGNNRQQNPRQNGGGNSNNGGNVDDNIDPDNTGGIDKLVEDIWSETKKKDDPAPPNTQPNNQPNTPAGTPEEQIANHLKSIGLEPLKLSEAEVADFQGGNVQGLVDKINQRMATTYIESMKAANTMTQKSIKTAVDEALNQSKNFVEGTQLRELLNTKLPFTKDAAIGPVAETIMQRLLTKGATKDQALDGVQKWFDRTFKTMNPDYQPNPNRNEGFRRTPTSASEDTDWMKALQG